MHQNTKWITLDLKTHALFQPGMYQKGHSCFENTNKLSVPQNLHHSITFRAYVSLMKTTEQVEMDERTFFSTCFVQTPYFLVGLIFTFACFFSGCYAKGAVKYNDDNDMYKNTNIDKYTSKAGPDMGHK